jgi:hypothetical protein
MHADETGIDQLSDRVIGSGLRTRRAARSHLRASEVELFPLLACAKTSPRLIRPRI